MKCPICELNCTDIDPGISLEVTAMDDQGGRIGFYDSVVQYRCEGGHSIYVNPTDVSNQREAETDAVS